MILVRSISPFERFGIYTPIEDAALTVHLFVAGETLSGLAHRYYGDWRMWRVIANRNVVSDPRQIAAGTQILIPVRPLETGNFERN